LVETERGYVSKRFSYWAAESYESVKINQHGIRMAVLGLFVPLNILMPFVLGKIVLVYCLKSAATVSSREKQMYIELIFWASSLCAFAVNTIYIYITVRHYVSTSTPLGIMKCIIPQGYPCTIPANTTLYKDTAMVFIAKAVIIPPLLIIEFLISALITKNPNFPKPPCPGRMLLVCCHNSCKSFLIKVFQTFALYQIIMFIQILTISAVPVCVLFFVSPPHTILMISFLAFSCIGFTVFVLHFLYSCERCITNFSSWSIRLRSCRSMCVHLMILIAGSSMLIAAVYLYGVMLYTGINMAGIQGLGFSLLPSFLLSVAGWAVKKRLHRARNSISHRVHKERPQQRLRNDSEAEDELMMQSLLQEQNESETA